MANGYTAGCIQILEIDCVLIYMIRTKPQIITLRFKSAAYNTVRAYVHLPGAPFAFKYSS